MTTVEDHRWQLTRVTRHHTTGKVGRSVDGDVESGWDPNRYRPDPSVWDETRVSFLPLTIRLLFQEWTGDSLRSGC